MRRAYSLIGMIRNQPIRMRAVMSCSPLKQTVFFSVILLTVGGCQPNAETRSAGTSPLNEATLERAAVLEHGRGGDESERGKTIRFATFNVSLYRKRAGQLAADLASGGDEQAHQVAEIIQRLRPDVLLLNEFDYDADRAAAESFQTRYLQVDHGDAQSISYSHRFQAPSNTGQPSGLDLDHDGEVGGPGDCFGYGLFPGQYGMLVLSNYPIQTEHVRTFREFLWRDMPGAHLPVDSEGRSYYSDEELVRFRLSSKSHWDVPISFGGDIVHFLVSHPTPPVFDGPEDRNGKRNHDEIRLFADYIDPGRAQYLVDDNGQAGGLPVDASFVIAGDLNADPHDGDSYAGAVNQLLQHPLVDARQIPSSVGALELAQVGVNSEHVGDASHDTGDFDDRRVGNLRIDYVLPSKTLLVSDAGVFWPPQNSPLSKLAKASDHHLVWMDVSVQ